MVSTRLKVNTNGRAADRPNGAALVGIVVGISCFILVIVFIALSEYVFFSTKKVT